jgi:2,3-bisphosphoglycerate-independent phosphoglycerate mutase
MNDHQSTPPTALVILDGFGISKEVKGNAVMAAQMANWKMLCDRYPCIQLAASGKAVGLLPGCIGNSEVGHLTLGAGRIIPSILKQFHDSIKDKSFEFHPLLHKRFVQLNRAKGRLHLMGLLSDGGVHSHIEDLEALILSAQRHDIKQIFIHAFLDGRDVLPQSAATYLERIEQFCARVGVGLVASIHGRFYAMDRDHNWERTQASYQVLCENSGLVNLDWQKILDENYAQAIFDEFIPPTLLQAEGAIKEGDGVIFFNFRPDRAQQLTHAFLDQNFSQFQVPLQRSKLNFFMTTTRYDKFFLKRDCDVIFEDQIIENTLLDEIALQARDYMKVFIIAETEKYAHVTYFFRGMRNVTLPHEIRVLIPSIKAATYMDFPQMSALQITDSVKKSLIDDPANFYLINYANADMVGHSGNFEATVKACEVLDQQLGILFDEFVIKRQGTLFITSDHGNAEEKIDVQTGQPRTAHTTNPVPLVIASNTTQGMKIEQTDNLGLCNVAPTILEHLRLVIPQEMAQPLIIKKL